VKVFNYAGIVKRIPKRFADTGGKWQKMATQIAEKGQLSRNLNLDCIPATRKHWRDPLLEDGKQTECPV
jgi:hypothetical protein